MQHREARRSRIMAVMEHLTLLTMIVGKTALGTVDDWVSVRVPSAFVRIWPCTHRSLYASAQGRTRVPEHHKLKMRV